MATPRGERDRSSAASLFDRLPGSADELPRGQDRAGKIKKFHIIPDAEFGAQVHVVTESDTSSTGKLENWWKVGKPGSDIYKPSQRSKGGLFMRAVQDCLGKPIPWGANGGGLLTHDEKDEALKHKTFYWSLELQEHDMGQWGVFEDHFPVLIQKEPIEESDLASVRKNKPADIEDEDDPDEDNDDDDDDGDEDEDDDEIAGYPKDVVEVALALMADKNERQFKARAKKSRPLAEFADDIADGSFVKALIEAGYVEMAEDDTYALIDDDDDDD